MTPEQLIRELQAFRTDKTVLKQVRKDIRKPVPSLKAAIKAKALAILPTRGGLSQWVAASKIGFTLKFPPNAVAIKVKGGRNSQGGRSDIKRIDQGRVRAPAWGRKFQGQWHTQGVTPGFFTDPVEKSVGEFEDAIEQAIDTATAKLRG